MTPLGTQNSESKNSKEKDAGLLSSDSAGKKEVASNECGMGEKPLATPRFLWIPSAKPGWDGGNCVKKQEETFTFYRKQQLPTAGLSKTVYQFSETNSVIYIYHALSWIPQKIRPNHICIVLRGK